MQIRAAVKWRQSHLPPSTAPFFHPRFCNFRALGRFTPPPSAVGRFSHPTETKRERERGSANEAARLRPRLASCARSHWETHRDAIRSALRGRGYCASRSRTPHPHPLPLPSALQGIWLCMDGACTRFSDGFAHKEPRISSRLLVRDANSRITRVRVVPRLAGASFRDTFLFFFFFLLSLKVHFCVYTFLNLRIKMSL